jgi:hypothetical protein
MNPVFYKLFCTTTFNWCATESSNKTIYFNLQIYILVS